MVLPNTMATDWLLNFHAAIFAGAGLLGTIGHLCLAWAYKRAPAGRLGMLEYSAFIWASVLGFAVFGEVPGLATLAGTAIIIVACLAGAWSSGAGVPPGGAISTD